MGVAQFASLRSQLPSPTVAAVAGGNLTGSGTVEIALQGRNRAGFNLPTALQSVAYTAGQKIQITIPATARAAGEDIHWYVVSIPTIAADLTSIRQVAIYNGYDTDQVTPRALPAIIELTEDAHLVVGAAQAVANLAALPTGTDLINGMIRQVSDIGDGSSRILRYDAESIATVDNDRVFSAAVGRWIQTGSFSTYVSNTEDAGGCDRPLLNIPDPSIVLQPANYAADGSTGTPVRLWWIGSRNASGPITPQGRRIGWRVFDDGIERTAQFDGLFEAAFKGYVSLADGTLDIANMTIGTFDFRFGKAGAYLLEKDLPAAQAAEFSVAPKFSVAEVEGLDQGSTITLIPKLFAQSGDANPVSGLTGNLIYPTGNRMRVIPDTGLGVRVQSGSGAIGLLTFPVVAEQGVTGLTSGTANQYVHLNGNGLAFVGDGIPGPNEAIRAKVSTVAGQSDAAGFSAYAAVGAGNTLTVTVTHGRDIRVDYPEPSSALSVLAGNTEATFNPPSGALYIQRQSDGEIREFTFSTVDAATQGIAIATWASGAIVGSVPVAPSANFSLFEPTGASFVTAAGGSDFIADNYRVTAAYVYNGGQVTTIQHEAEAPITDWAEEALTTLSDALERVGGPYGTFSGAAATFTPPIQGKFFLKTDVDPAILYYSTGIGQGDLLQVAGDGSGGGGSGIEIVADIAALRALSPTAATIAYVISKVSIYAYDPAGDNVTYSDNSEWIVHNTGGPGLWYPTGTISGTSSPSGANPYPAKYNRINKSSPPDFPDRFYAHAGGGSTRWQYASTQQAL